MTPEDLARLLVKANALDPRLVVNDIVMEMWLETVGDLVRYDAERALVEHYRNSEDKVLPVHIRRLADRYRAERVRKIPPNEVLMADCLELHGVHFTSLLRARRKAMGDGEASTVEEAARLAPPPPRLQLAQPNPGEVSGR